MSDYSLPVEVVYYRYHSVYAEDFDTVEEALRFIETGEEYGEMSSVGVFVNGEPHIYSGYVDKDPPTPKQADEMRADYATAHR